MRRHFVATSFAGLAVAAMLTTATIARAEHLIVSVSNHRVTVTPNYAGEELVLFGAIEQRRGDAGKPRVLRRRGYDLRSRAPPW